MFFTIKNISSQISNPKSEMNSLALVGLMVCISIIMVVGPIFEIYAQSPESSKPPLFVDPELSLYSSGSTVKISGFVKTLNENYEQPVIIRILDNNGKIVSIGQVMPQLDGTFSFSTRAGGTWQNSGEYKILVSYGAQKADNTFQYIAGEAVPTIPPPPPPPKCTANQILINGKCVDKQPDDQKPQCGPNQILVDNTCIDKEPEEQQIVCEPGFKLVNGRCVAEITDTSQPNGCLIATASFGSELAPQVQLLREIRDNTILSTTSGSSFMTGFNVIYYSFSPTVADWERQNPVFKEGVKMFITPMISSLNILQLAEQGSEMQVLTLGISIIALNIGMYIVAPVVVGYKLNNYFRTKK